MSSPATDKELPVLQTPEEGLPKLLTPRSVCDAGRIYAFMKENFHDRSPAGSTKPVCPFVLPSIKQNELFVGLHYGIDGSDLQPMADVLQQHARWLLQRPAKTLTVTIAAFPDIPDEDGAVIDDLFFDVGYLYLANGLQMGQFFPTNEEGVRRDEDLKVSKSPIPFMAIRPILVHDILLFKDAKPDRFHAYYRLFADQYAAGRVTNPEYLALWQDASPRYLAWREGNDLPDWYDAPPVRV